MARGYDDYDDDYDDRDDYDRPPRRPEPFPGTVMAAGVIWLVNGGLILLTGVFLLVLAFGFARHAGQIGGQIAGAIICVYAVVAIFGVAFVFVGIQTVRGTASDTLGNAIGSLVFGGLGLIGLLRQMSEGTFGPLELIFSSIGTFGLIVAGILALVGRDQYRKWKRAHNPRVPIPRRRRRRDDDYDDEYDD